MKRPIIYTAITALSIGLAQAAVVKLDGSNGIVTSSFTSGSPSTTYRVIDVSLKDGTSSDADGIKNGILELKDALPSIDGGDDTQYILDAITFVENGVLKIPAGSIIRGEPRSASLVNDPGTLVITRSARIDAQGTPANPIIFTTAAIDNEATPNRVPDGVNITVLNPDTEDWYFTKHADQWTGSEAFLDSDPKGSPLAPTRNFAAKNPGDAPVTIDDSGTFPNTSVNTFPDTALSYIENDTEYRSLWGGVIILGNAPTSIGRIEEDPAGNFWVRDSISNDPGNQLDKVFEGFIEGLDLADIGGKGVYGGPNPNDSSGVMRYVSIRHGGSGIGAGNEINGLTLGGVGRGTLIEYIEVYCNGDDGYEFFGGTVDTKYLISLYNNDDSFDIDEGYTGRGQFWFSLHLDDRFNGDHGGEHDGTDANYDSVNVRDYFAVGETAGNIGSSSGDDNGGGLNPAFITIYNATYIGGGTFGNENTDSGRNRIFRIRDGFGGIYRNSIFSDFRDSQLRIDNDAEGRILADEVVFENNLFYGIGTSITSYTSMYAYDLTPAASYTGDLLDLESNGNSINIDPFNVRRNGGSGIFGADPKFDRRGSFNNNGTTDTVGLDPRGDDGVAEVNSATGEAPTFFTNVSYKGAFNPLATTTNIWTGSAASPVANPAWSVFGAKVLDLQ